MNQKVKRVSVYDDGDRYGIGYLDPQPEKPYMFESLGEAAKWFSKMAMLAIIGWGVVDIAVHLAAKLGPVWEHLVRMGLAR